MLLRTSRLGLYYVLVITTLSGVFTNFVALNFSFSGPTCAILKNESINILFFCSSGTRSRSCSILTRPRARRPGNLGFLFPITFSLAVGPLKALYRGLVANLLHVEKYNYGCQPIDVK